MAARRAVVEVFALMDNDPRAGVRRACEARLRTRRGARAGGGPEADAVEGRARRVSGDFNYLEELHELAGAERG